jgi:HEAT repeat protein
MTGSFTTLVTAFKVLQVVYKITNWAYEKFAERTPVKNAIAATAADFPNASGVESALIKLIESDEFGSEVERAKAGEDVDADERLANLLTEIGGFYTGINSNHRDAVRVIETFLRYLQTEMLRSPDAHLFAELRAEIRHRKTIEAIRQTRQDPQATLEVGDRGIVEQMRDAASEMEAEREVIAVPAGRRSEELWRKYSERLSANVSKVRLLGESEYRELKQVFVQLNIVEEYQRPSTCNEWMGFVDPALRKRRALFSAAADDGEEDAEEEEKRLIKAEELLRDGTRAVVTGAPGCGKSTLLRWLAGRYLDNSALRLPVFLELKSITKKLFDDCGGNLGDLLFEQAVAPLLHFTDQQERATLKSAFTARLAAHRVVIFLDGLDEVRNTDFFAPLCEAINRFLDSPYGQNLLLISTRPYALDMRFRDAREMEIAPLNRAQITDFLKHYYGDDPRVDLRGLLQQIGRSEFGELVRVPVLLGAMVRRYCDKGELTSDRLKLYKDLVHDLVVTRDAEDNIRRFKDEDNDGLCKLRFLEQVAFKKLFVESAARDDESWVFTTEWLFDEAKTYCPQFNIKPQDFVADVKATALLREVAKGVWAFSHLTIQEYLAAKALAGRSNCEHIFCRAYFNPTLAEIEVLPMTLGLMDRPDSLYATLAQLPESLSLTGLRLRARALGYTSVSQQTLKELLDRLDRFISSEAPEERGYHDAVLKAYANAGGEVLETILQHIAKSLNSDREFNERENAVEALALFHHDSAATLLRKAISDNHSDVRIRAAVAMNWFDPDLTITALKKELNNPDEEVRQKVVYAAWQLAGENAREVLIKALRDESKTVRESAIEALGDIGGEHDVSLLIEFLNTEPEGSGEKAAKSLGGIGGDAALTGLLNNLVRPNCKARKEIIQALGDIGDARAVPSLLKIIEDGRANDREEAVKALGKIKSDPQIEPLKNLYSQVRTKWIEQLGKIDDSHGFLLGKENYESLLIIITESLWNLGELVGIESLLDILEKGYGYNSLNAVRVLAAIGDDVANEALLAAWNKAISKYASNKQERHAKNEGARNKSVLKTIPDSPPETSSTVQNNVIHIVTVLDPLPDLLVRLADALTTLGHHHVVPIIVEWLDDPKFVGNSMDNGKLAHIVNSLGRCKEKQAAEGLVKIFHCSHIHSKFMALTGLGNFHNAYAIPGLLRGFLEFQRYFQMRAVYRMVSMENEEILDGLTLALSDSHNFVRRKALEFIAYYSNDPGLIEQLRLFAANDASEKARKAASQSLQRFERKLQFFDDYSISKERKGRYLMSAKKVFISYNHEDRLVADKLKSALEAEGIIVTIDNAAMRAGVSIQEFIESSIRDSDLTLSIVSNRSLLSAWVALESITAFYSEKLRGDKRFIACYLDDDFFETGFRLKATEQIDAKIKDIDDKIPKYIERKIDTNDLNGEKSRLIKLRNDLGDILQKLKDSLTLDIRESEFDRSLARIIKSIEEIPGRP